MHARRAVAKTAGAWPRVGSRVRRKPAHFPDKTEAYEIFRHPEGGRKDVIPLERHRRQAGRRTRNLSPGRRNRPGSARAAGDLAARMDPAGPRELEAAGIIDSKFGTVTLFRRAGGTEAARVLPRLYQACRRAEVADLRLVVPGRRLAGPPRRDRLHAQPADPADGRKRSKTGGIVRPCRSSGAAIVRPRPRRPCRRTG